jgi:hypothetical protein
MGLGLEHFTSQINANFICPICLGVLEDPVQDNKEHTFCRVCIYNALNRDLQCPVDRSPLIRQELKAVPRILTNLLSELDVYCNFKDKGCQAILKYSHLKNHLLTCTFNTLKPFVCPNGCGSFATQNELDAHSCILILQKYNQDLQKTLFDASQHFKGEILRLENKIFELQNKLVSILQ